MMDQALERNDAGIPIRQLGTQYYDAAKHRDQHGFPPVGTVGPW